MLFTDEGSFDSWHLKEAGYMYLVFDSDMNKWLGKGHHAVIGLEPGETDILYHPFRRSDANVPAHIIEQFGGKHALVGQAAVFGPAKRASFVPPAVATRTV